MFSSSLRTAAAASVAFSLLSQIATVSAANMNAITYVGCFSSSAPLSDQGSYTFQTSGYCQGLCYPLGDAAMGMTNGSDCWCGSSLPALANKVDDSKCATACQGYPSEKCGADGYWSVYKTGVDDSVGYLGGGSSSSSSSLPSSTSTTRKSSSSSTKLESTTAAPTTTAGSATTTNAPVVITSEAPGKTVIITLSATSTGTSSPNNSNKGKSGGGTNTAGIAAGVVVGVVVLLAIAGGVFFWMRQKKRRQIEEEYSKRSQAQDYNANGMAGARGVSVRSANDARLDPEAMMHRRLSDGSIADEQDYSRRILKVTN